MHPVAIQVASKPGRVSNQNPNSLWTSFSNRLRRTRASVIEALRVKRTSLASLSRSFWAATRSAAHFDSDESFGWRTAVGRAIPTTAVSSGRGLLVGVEASESSVMSGPLFKKRAVRKSKIRSPGFMKVRGQDRTLLVCPHTRSSVAKKRILPPSDLPPAREEFLHQLLEFDHLSAFVQGNAFAIPSKACDNLDCDQLHLSEDCTLALMCSGCTQIGPCRTWKSGAMRSMWNGETFVCSLRSKDCWGRKGQSFRR